MTAPSMDKSLETILKEVEKFVAGLTTSYEAEEKALAVVRAADAALIRARKKAAVQGAAHIVKTGMAPPDRILPEERRLKLCRDALIQIRTEIASHDADLLSMRERLNAAQERYNSKVIAEFLEKEFLPVQKNYQALLRKAAGLADALQEPFTPPPRPTASQEGLDRVFQIPGFQDWESDPSAKALHDRHQGPGLAGHKLAQFANAARSRVLSQEKARRFRGLQAGTGVDIDGKFIVNHPHVLKLDGKEFPPGSVIDRFTMPEGYLRGALLTRKIRPMTAEEELASQPE